jgi:hypothetical protein
VQLLPLERAGRPANEPGSEPFFRRLLRDSDDFRARGPLSLDGRGAVLGCAGLLAGSAGREREEKHEQDTRTP